jgi:hypothetical protein
LREKTLMKLHLWTCGKCSRYLEQIKFISEAAHKHEESITEKESPTVRMNSEAKDRLTNALKSAVSSAL